MSRALATTRSHAQLTTEASRPLRPGRAAPAKRAPLPPPRDRIDPEMAVALVEMLREQRVNTASEIAEGMAARGADSVVCDFLGDDLREAAHSLADVEAWLQTTLDVLERPSASTLFEQAGDVGVLNNLEHLFQTVDNLRRRLMQASVGLR